MNEIRKPLKKSILKGIGMFMLVLGIIALVIGFAVLIVLKILGSLANGLFSLLF